MPSASLSWKPCQFCGTSKQLTEFCICLQMVYSAVDFASWAVRSPIPALLYTSSSSSQVIICLYFSSLQPKISYQVWINWINVTSTNSCQFCVGSNVVHILLYVSVSE